jgi:hypothetical protein
LQNRRKFWRLQILGREVGNIYSRAELKHLIQIHVENPEHQEESGLTVEDHQLLSGALDYKARPLLLHVHLRPACMALSWGLTIIGKHARGVGGAAAACIRTLPNLQPACLFRLTARQHCVAYARAAPCMGKQQLTHAYADGARRTSA